MQVASFLNRTEGVKKAHANFRKALRTVQDYHRQIWPGVPVPVRQSQYAKGGAHGANIKPDF